MRETEAIEIADGQVGAFIEPETIDVELIDNGVALTQLPDNAAYEAPGPFDDPNFMQRLVEHMHRAKLRAIAEAREAGLNGNS